MASYIQPAVGLYFEMLFLEILPSVWKLGFPRSSHNYVIMPLLMMRSYVIITIYKILHTYYVFNMHVIKSTSYKSAYKIEK